ncbi:MAG: hypothetical protein JWN69_2205, partial [Alphaproteobacteria bacterium]|nr:hypothetical protein [Alphaproteobacteria bacterium]
RDATLKWRFYRWLDEHMPWLLHAYRVALRREAKARR